jgi:hypothetical protein
MSVMNQISYFLFILLVLTGATFAINALIDLAIR